MQLSVIVIIYSEMDISRTEVSRVEIKREVDRVSTLTFTLTCDLSYIASILFAKLNFQTHVRITRQWKLTLIVSM